MKRNACLLCSSAAGQATTYHSRNVTTAGPSRPPADRVDVYALSSLSPSSTDTNVSNSKNPDAQTTNDTAWELGT